MSHHISIFLTRLDRKFNRIKTSIALPPRGVKPPLKLQQFSVYNYVIIAAFVSTVDSKAMVVPSPPAKQPVSFTVTSLIGKIQEFFANLPDGRKTATANNLPGRRVGLLPRGSHRSGRAQFGHPAPQSKHSLRGIDAMDHTRRRERIALGETGERGPVQAGRSGATVQPLAPETTNLMAEPGERSRVAGDSVIGIVPFELATENLLLLRHRSVTVASAPLPDLPQSATEAGLGRLALHHPAPLPGAPPIVGKAE